MNVLMRVDIDKALGMGHVMRCLILARALKKKGHVPFFVCRSAKSQIKDIIIDEGFPVLLLDASNSLLQDAQETAEIARKKAVSVIVSDICHRSFLKENQFFLRYFEILKSAVRCLIFIDDFHFHPGPFDLHILPYHGAKQGPYRSESGKHLIGCKYFIISESIKRNRGKWKVRKKANRVLIAISGSDPKGASLRVALLLKLNAPRHWQFRLVIGSGFINKNKSKLRNLVQTDNRFQLVYNTRSLAESLRWCDIAITGGGLTKYEAAVMGVPVVMVTQFHVESLRAKKFSGAGTSIFLGNYKKLRGSTLRKAILDLLTNHRRRKKMSLRGRKLVDGLGTDRIVREITRLRPAGQRS